MLNISHAWGRDSSSPQCSRLSEYFVREISEHTTKIKNCLPSYWQSNGPQIIVVPVLMVESRKISHGMEDPIIDLLRIHVPSILMLFWQSDTSLPALPMCQGLSTSLCMEESPWSMWASPPEDTLMEFFQYIFKWYHLFNLFSPYLHLIYHWDSFLRSSHIPQLFEKF